MKVAYLVCIVALTIQMLGCSAREISFDGVPRADSIGVTLQSSEEMQLEGVRRLSLFESNDAGLRRVALLSLHGNIEQEDYHLVGLSALGLQQLHLVVSESELKTLLRQGRLEQVPGEAIACLVLGTCGERCADGSADCVALSSVDGEWLLKVSK